MLVKRKMKKKRKCKNGNTRTRTTIITEAVSSKLKTTTMKKESFLI